GDGVGQARAQHHELLLALVFGSAAGAADGVIETPELALGSGVHIAHAAHHSVGLVVQVQRIADELVDIDLGRALETATVAAAVSATVAATVIATTATLAGTARAG